MQTIILQYWQQLQPRERLIVSIGATLLCLMLFYTFIWQPWHTAINHMQTALPSKRADLVWMRQQSEMLANGSITQSKKYKGKNQSLLSVIEQSAKAAGVRQSIQQMVPRQNNQEVSVVLEETSFNKWLRWVDILHHQYAVNIKQLSAERVSRKADTADIRVTFNRQI